MHIKFSNKWNLQDWQDRPPLILHESKKGSNDGQSKAILCKAIIHIFYKLEWTINNWVLLLLSVLH